VHLVCSRRGQKRAREDSPESEDDNSPVESSVVEQPDVTCDAEMRKRSRAAGVFVSLRQCLCSVAISLVFTSPSGCHSTAFHAIVLTQRGKITSCVYLFCCVC